MFGLFAQDTNGLVWLGNADTAAEAWEMRLEYVPEAYDVFMVLPINHLEQTN